MRVEGGPVLGDGRERRAWLRLGQPLEAGLAGLQRMDARELRAELLEQRRAWAAERLVAHEQVPRRDALDEARDGEGATEHGIVGLPERLRRGDARLEGRARDRELVGDAVALLHPRVALRAQHEGDRLSAALQGAALEGCVDAPVLVDRATREGRRVADAHALGPGRRSQPACEGGQYSLVAEVQRRSGGAHRQLQKSCCSSM